MKIVKLTNGKDCLVDDEDFEELNSFTWYEGTGGYAKRHKRINGKLTTIIMHRFISKCPENKIIDHINQNTLDNRKSNLRIADKSKNSMNRGKQKNNSSGYKGVYYDKRHNHYDSYITCNKKRTYLGSFKTAIEAAKAYNEAALIMHGKFSCLNEV